METTRTFKIHLGDEVRRFKLDTTGPAAFDSFECKIKDLFRGDELVFKWKDSDGDLITIANADDFAEAISEQPTGPVRFYASASRAASRTTSSSTLPQQPEPEQGRTSLKDPVAAKEPEPEPEPEPRKAEPVVHPHVVCDGTGEQLTGTRYHKAGHNFDLCETEFAKLPEQEKQLFEIILYPGAAPVPYEPIIHYGVVCDGSEATPIIGARFHKIGEDFDLCQVEFAKLDEDEKQLYEIIVHPRRSPIPYKRPDTEIDDDVGGPPEFLKMLQSVIAGLPGGDGIDIDLSQLCQMMKQQGKGRGPCGGKWRRCPYQRKEVVAGEVLPKPTFGIGSFGPGVEQLQRFLIKHDLMDQSAIAWRAGLFGPRTQKAISMFQKTNKLSSDQIGRYDDTTHAALLAVANIAQGETAAKEEKPEAAAQSSNSLDANARTNDLTVPDASDVATASKWANELESLNAMGFVDNDALIALLDRKHGQVDLVISELLQ